MSFFDYLIVPFGYVMQFCCWIFPNYLAALAVFTVLIQLLLCLIFGIKTQKNSLKQAALAPKVAALRKKYAGRTDQATRLKMQEETQKMYQENGFNPMGGCLPMLIQLPIILALYQVIVNPLRYICGVFRFDGSKIATIVENFKNAGIHISEDMRTQQYDIIRYIVEHKDETEHVKTLLEGQDPSVLPTFSIGGFDMSQTPEFASILVLVPVLIFVVMIVSQIITRRFTYQDPAVKEQQNSISMKIMMYTTPLISVYVSFYMPAAVGIYWIYRSIAATLQQMILYKIMPPPTFTEEDYKAAERELNGSSKKKKKSGGSLPSGSGGEKKRSLHHIDDEDEGDTSPAEKQAPAAKEPKQEKEESKRDLPPAAPSDAPVMKEDKGTKHYKKK
ncbi:MAG: membrane protein insertase YidC [Clostridiales bacterium]|jgi:YidC/Oxa1 family membrane protein insertase|nr:membrane protein insertase YidC [Clostridiales bacterium]